MRLPRPFIRLPWSFDAERLAAEVSALGDAGWMSHPSRLQGNTALPLVSKDGNSNDDFEGEMLPTTYLAQCPYLRQVLGSFGVVLGRTRLMKLAAGCEVSQHVDFNYHWYSRVRVHIPVVTNPAVTFFCGPEKVHMAAGESWIFDSWRRHRVTNESDIDRIHLVFDTAGSNNFWQAVDKMSAMNGADWANVQEVIGFDADADPDLATEKYNVSPVMSPGEMQALVDDLIEDFEQHPDNDESLVEDYKRQLQSLCRDWRQVWSQYGFEKAGFPEYQRLLDNARDALHPDRKALLTSSNRIGVNPVIVQRILRSALAPDVQQQFSGGESKSP